MEIPHADFGIEINFEKGTSHPSRIFRAMSELIEAFQQLDKSLISSIDDKIEPIILLEDIEAGSLRAWLRQVIQSVDDQALGKLEWKPIVGKYLVSAKIIIIKFLEGKTEIKERAEIEQLQNDLFILAEKTEVKQIPAYSPIAKQSLVDGIGKISEAIANLEITDTASLITQDQTIGFNVEFQFSPESIEAILTREVLTSKSPMILRVKKPDYLGDSQWEFRFDNRTIPAKILDTDWLVSFQNRLIDVRPGDAIRADVETSVKYDYNGEVLSIHYSVLKVVEVIPVTYPNQSPLFPEQ